MGLYPFFTYPIYGSSKRTTAPITTWPNGATGRAKSLIEILACFYKMERVERWKGYFQHLASRSSGYLPQRARSIKKQV